MKQMNLSILFVLLIILLTSGYSPIRAFQQNDSLEITYFANYGALMQAGDRQVLIDGLFRQGVPGYARVPEATLQVLEKAAPPYDQIDLLLVSHPHADHFEASSVAAHLRNNPDAVLFSSGQVVSATRKALNGAAKDRLIEVTPEWKEREQKVVVGIEIEVLRIRHGYARNYGLHNLGHIIHLGGKKILHLGDAEMIEENFAPFDLPAEKIDVALLPYWFLTSEQGQAIVKNLIQPKAIIAMHIEPAKSARVRREVEAAFPNARAFVVPMEKVVF